MYHPAGSLLAACAIAGLCLLVSAERKTKSCCWPNTFESLLAIEGGIVSESFPPVFQAETKLYFDASNQRWGVIDGRYHVNGAYEGHFITLDYAKEKQHQAKYQCYEISLGDKHPFKMVHPCIGEDAILVGTYRLGYGDNSMEYDMWQWEEVMEDTYDGQSDRTVMRASVTSDCVWLSETALWKRENDPFNYTVSFGFFDQQFQFKRDNVFAEMETFDCAAGNTPDAGYFDPLRAKHLMYLARRLRTRKPGMESVEEETLTARSKAPTIVH